MYTTICFFFLRFIGQFADPQNPSINQLPRKMALQRAYQTIGGSCQWYAAAVIENQGRYRDALISEYHKYPALVPVFDFMDDKAPDKVRKMKKVWTEDGYILFWTAPKADTEMDKAVRYVVYRFGNKEGQFGRSFTYCSYHPQSVLQTSL